VLDNHVAQYQLAAPQSATQIFENVHAFMRNIAQAAHKQGWNCQLEYLRLVLP
jgi:hypothetical protein